MALQGDLSSFALADVLRLLAGTAKTGALEVSSSTGSGEVWLREGAVVGGAVPAAPHATRSSDVVLELLRFDGGTFAFDDTINVTEAGGSSVDDTLTEAQALLEEWHDVEQTVPSMDAWISLAPELSGDDVTVTASDWRILAVIAGGTSVSGLASVQSLTDLAASRQVKALVEQGVASVGNDQPHGSGPGLVKAPVVDEPVAVDPEPDVIAEPEMAEPEPAAPDEALAELVSEPMVDEIDEPEPEATDADLAMLRSDDRPVLLGAADSDLLPEPLPGDGASFEEFDDHDGVAESEAPGVSDDRTPVMAGGDDGAAVAEDNERGSLLRFLSTTKP